MPLMLVLLIVIGIFTFLNFIDIKNLKKENTELKRQYKIAMQTIDYLKRKINGDPPPNIAQKPTINEQTIIRKEPIYNVSHKKKENLENVFGKNIIGIIAAILIFIGIIAFGALIFTRITDGMKVLLMALGSFGLLGLGSFLCSKNKNAFTLSLTGTGAGAIYISIFVTHIYFCLINSIFAYALVLMWAVGMLLLSKKLEANILSYIIHIGCVLSIFLAIGYGQLESMAIEIAIYTVLITGILLVMDYKFFRNIFKISAWGMSFVNFIICAFMSNNIITKIVEEDEIFSTINYSNYTIIVALFLVSTIIYAINLKTDNKLFENLISHGVYLFQTLLTFLPATINIILESNDLTYEYYESFTTMDRLIIDNIPTMITIAIMLISFTMITFLVKNKTLFSTSILSHLTFFSLICIIKIFDCYEPQISLIIIPTIICMVLYHLSKQSIYWYFSLGFAICDAIFSTSISDTNSTLGLLYCLFLFVILILQGIQKKNIFYFPAVYLAYNNIFILIPLGICFDTITDNQGILYASLITMIINIILYGCQLYFVKEPLTNAQKISNIFSGIIESIIIFAYSLFILFEHASYSEANLAPWFWTLSILLLVFGMFKIRNLINNKNTALGIWYSLKFTWLTIFPLTQLTGLMDEQFIFSLICMIIATICIVFGFKFNIKSMRIYGLIVVLASVLKIVVIDMWGQDSIIRVISLIIGGAICFAISAGYNYIEKNKLNKGD